MKLFKKVLATTMAMTLAVNLMACGGGSGSSSNEASSESASEATESTSAADESAGGGDYKIMVVTMALNSDYWHMVEAGAKLAGKDLGVQVDVVGPNDESDSTTEINMVEDAVTNGYDAIVLAANEPTSLVSAAETVKAAGIPLILIDTKLNSDDESIYANFVGTSNYDAAGQGGDFIAANVPEGAQVGIIRGAVGTQVHDNRANGAKDVMEAAGLEVVSVQPADSDRAKAVNVTENMLQANPDIKGFFCTNDDMALGCYEACHAAGKDDIVIVGFDGTFNAMDSIEAGQMSASVAQQPVEEGYQGVANAVKTLNGESVEKDIPLPVVLLKADNIADFRADLETKISESGVKLG